MTNFGRDPDVGSSQLSSLESLAETVPQDSLRIIEQRSVEVPHASSESSWNGSPTCLWFEADPFRAVSPIPERAAIAQDRNRQAVLQLKCVLLLAVMSRMQPAPLDVEAGAGSKSRGKFAPLRELCASEAANHCRHVGTWENCT
eukprot:CAMPEP_0206448400 /NCGR_PEP_ID=MMETSP0324_2-20121206/17444_1 /ASSEMBLY_ACC=CAM_ASM_000836 /TAXON_ID=2866 /ORGANISM="Crypthecodinium cohnii, Strain Seligo" /LENGTH=143 /DNA_ID=CAMNT_0053917525 /DNA_START=230 /DNA_END=661 /DNA_ORIENTATION=+